MNKVILVGLFSDTGNLDEIGKINGSRKWPKQTHKEEILSPMRQVELFLSGFKNNC